MVVRSYNERLFQIFYVFCSPTLKIYDSNSVGQEAIFPNWLEFFFKSKEQPLLPHMPYFIEYQCLQYLCTHKTRIIDWLLHPPSASL